MLDGSCGGHGQGASAASLEIDLEQLFPVGFETLGDQPRGDDAPLDLKEFDIEIPEHWLSDQAKQFMREAGSGATNDAEQAAKLLAAERDAQGVCKEPVILDDDTNDTTHESGMVRNIKAARDNGDLRHR